MSEPHPEEISQAELRSTEISPRTARGLTWAFVVVLAAVPIWQGAVEIARRESPQAFDVFQPLADAVKSSWRGDVAGVRRQLETMVSRDFPTGFEASLTRASAAKSFVQPRLQRVLTETLGFGNDKVAVGRNGWLFYQPGVDYLTGPDITEPAYLATATKKMIDKNGAREPNPDSRAAWLQLNRDCIAAGIRLVVVPVPDKAMLQPEQLTRRASHADGEADWSNRGFLRLVADLRSQGVDVFDPTPAIVRSGEIRYLQHDTHWTPEAMDAVAAALARHLDPAPADDRTNPFQLVPTPVARVGDLVDMLKLPGDQALFSPQPVTVQVVQDRRTGQRWARNPESDVMLLGDSFTNIYSQADMGWGQSAGLAEHVSYHLGRAVDVLAINGGAASAVRAELARRVSSAHTRTTRTLVYEVAVRFLMGESWPVVQTAFPPVLVAASSSPPIAVPATVPPVATPDQGKPDQSSSRVAPVRPAAEPGTGSAPPASLAAATVDSASAPLKVVAEVLQTSRVPAPGTAPYKDCLVYLKLRVADLVSGRAPEPEVIGGFWAMRDDQWLPAASYAVGDRLELTLVPMEDTDRQTQALQRADDLNDFKLRVYFVTSESKR